MQHGCLHDLYKVSVILQSHWNFSDGLFNYIQACIFSRLKLLFNFYVKRIVRRQDFGAKFNLTYHNGAPVADILKVEREFYSNYYCVFLNIKDISCLLVVGTQKGERVVSELFNMNTSNSQDWLSKQTAVDYSFANTSLSVKH